MARLQAAWAWFPRWPRSSALGTLARTPFDQPAIVIDVPDTTMRLATPARGDFNAWRALREQSRDFLRPWEPVWPRDDLTWAGFRRRLRRYDEEFRSGRGYTFFLWDDERGELLGGASLTHVRRGVAQAATLGYWMGEKHSGKGLMRHAVLAIADYAFDVLKLARIEAACLPGNDRSARLLAKCGFAYEGRLRGYLEIAGKRQDHELYSLLAQDRPR